MSGGCLTRPGRPYGPCFLFLLLITFMQWREVAPENYGFEGLYPPGCDTAAAQQCEYDLLKCRLFSGPANDAVSSCRCGRIYFGQCLRRAGCEFAREVGALTKHEIYTKTCVDLIIKYDCPDVLICAVNCASDEQIQRNQAKIIPFNNYGKFYLRLSICNRKINEPRYAQYATVQMGFCSNTTGFTNCARYVPPFTYTPVAVPIDTTYIDVHYCALLPDKKSYYCFEQGEFAPVRLFGNTAIWPSSFDSPKSVLSICATDDDCLGSRCDMHSNPHMCEPKTLRHIINSGSLYKSNPYL